MSIRVGFIGVGQMAQAHIRALSTLEDAEIVGVYDVDLTRAREVADAINATAFERAEHVIDPSRVDAVFVCSPPFARGDIEEIAARNGIHIFVEKPLGLYPFRPPHKSANRGHTWGLTTAPCCFMLRP